MNPREFGVRLTQYRERARLSITQLAARAGVDYMQISRYEKGKNLPSLETAIRLAAILEVSLDDLVNATEPPAPPVFENTRLFERMRALDRLPAKQQELALHVLDTVIAGHELDDLSRRLRRA